MSRFRPGEPVALREIWQGKIWTGRPAIVAEDSPDAIALYLAGGSKWKRPFSSDGMPKRIPDGDWHLRDDVWTNDVLRISVPWERFSILPIRNEEGGLAYWYLNIETPLLRTPRGFDYMDQTLDIIVSPDLREWRWKDEDELAQAIDLGVYTREQADEIRSVGERALARFLSRTPPFDRDWDLWRLPPDWAVPHLPAGWDETKEIRRPS